MRLAASDPQVTRQDIRDAASNWLTDEFLLEAVLTAALGRLLCSLSAGVGAIPDFGLHSIAPPVHLPVTPSDSRSAADENAGFHLSAPELNADDFASFGFLQEQFGSVPNVFLAQTLRPNVIEAEAHAIRSLMVPDGALTRAQKRGLLLAREPSTADFAASDGALLNFATTLSVGTQFAIRDIQALRDQGFTEEQILEAVVATSLADFFSVLEVGLGSAPYFAARRISKPGPKTPAKKVHPQASDQRHTDVSLPVDPDGMYVAGVQEGDLAAFEELVKRHSRRVYQTLIGILGNPDDALDAMQDTFLKAFQHIAHFEGRAKFRGQTQRRRCAFQVRGPGFWLDGYGGRRPRPIRTPPRKCSFGD